ncbi:hypothetical protein C8Q74DRAFT_1306401 [Fomes fomentarius]|nr:hypothetical protein C8Q74DRAFT_1306401 [Fomes fomentarius]
MTLHTRGHPVGTFDIPTVQVLSCPFTLLTQATSPISITHLDVRNVPGKQAIDKIISLLCTQLISLRIAHHVHDEEGRLYPTNDHAWKQCPRLKYLYIRHCDWNHDVARYLSDEAADASNLPPALETLVWAPAWARVYTHHFYPDGKRRSDVRRFAKKLLRASRSLNTVIYGWMHGRYYTYSLEGSEWGAECRETWLDWGDAEEEAWRHVC